MPERPDLAYVVPRLRAALVGRTIDRFEVKRPVVLRVLSRRPAPELLVGRAVAGVERRAHMVELPLAPAAGQPDVRVVISPMLAGRFALAAPKDKAPADLAATFGLAPGPDAPAAELRYRDDVQMGKVYVCEAGAEAQIPGRAVIGLDVLDPAVFTEAAFTALAKKRADQVRVFLMDKSALDAMGNAYADEVLFEARIHPKARTRSLSTEALRRLWVAIPKVLGEAEREIERRAPRLDEKVRDFLKVRLRHGERCPRCGDAIRRAGVRGDDTYFCPTCQPDETGAGRIDWTAIPKRAPGDAPAEAAPAERPKRPRRRR